MFEAPQRKRGLDQKPVSKVVPLVMLLVVVLVAVGIQRWVATRGSEKSAEPVAGNAASTVSVDDILPASGVDQANEGWTITVDAGWAGVTDAALAKLSCAALTERLARPPSMPLDLVNEEGVQILRCP